MTRPACTIASARVKGSANHADIVSSFRYRLQSPQEQVGLVYWMATTIVTGSARADQAIEAFDEKERELASNVGTRSDEKIQPNGGESNKGSDAPVEDIELARLTEEQKKIVVAQV